MKLHRAKPSTLRQRHQPSDDSLKISSSFAYRARRSDEALNIGRRSESEKSTASQPGHFWLQRSGMIILLIALVVSLINVLSLSSSVRILPASSQVSLPNVAQYQAAADKLVASSFWNRSKITVNTGQISNRLLAQFPELATANVSIPLVSHKLIIYVQPAQPVLIIQPQHGGSLALDASGKAVASGTDIGSAALPVVTDMSGLTYQLGHQALPSGTVGFIQTVVAQLAAKQLTPSSMTLPAGTSELDVRPAGQNYIVKFNLQNNDARQQVGTYLATAAQLQTQHITPSQYIDVRVDGRAYYK